MPIKKLIFPTALILTASLILSACTKNDDLTLKQNNLNGINETDNTQELNLKSDSVNLQLKETNNMNNAPVLEKPGMQIDAKKNYTAILNTTAGQITIALNAQATPITVNNFVYLARQNFYDKTIFHRVIDGFMIQGGDPLGTGAGNPGYRFDDEAFSGEYTRGTVAMANAGPNTNGSQFFIMHQDYDLPKNYVIFGQVSAGLDVIDTIASVQVEPNASGEMSKPVEPVTIQSVEIIED